MNGVLQQYRGIGSVEGGSLIRPQGIEERLENEKAQLEDRLRKVSAALDALKSQPKVAELLETIIKVL